MRLARIVTGILLGAGGLGAQSPTPLPLTITACRIETSDRLPAGRGTPRCDLRNDGSKTILALGIRYDLILPDGTREPGAFDIDAAHTMPFSRGASEIAPRGLAALPEGGGSVVPAQATVEAARVTFLIFDDDTAVGDEKEIARMFERRRMRPTFWHKMEAILTEAMAQESDPGRVFALIRNRMESEQDPAFKAGAVGWYGEILARMTERRMALTHTTPQYILETLRTTIAEEKALCDQHLERRR